MERPGFWYVCPTGFTRHVNLSEFSKLMQDQSLNRLPACSACGSALNANAQEIEAGQTMETLEPLKTDPCLNDLICKM